MQLTQLSSSQLDQMHLAEPNSREPQASLPWDGDDTGIFFYFNIELRYVFIVQLMFSLQTFNIHTKVLYTKILACNKCSELFHSNII